MTDRTAAPVPPAIGSQSVGPQPIGRWAFGLGLLSTIVYFATSEGIRNFLAFVGTSVSKAMTMMGHGA